MSEPNVRISGTVLASLMFQHVNSDSDVEGLVLGESSFHEQVTISDSQSDHIHIEEIYNIQNHVACHKLNTLYSSSGEVDLAVLQEMLADTKQDSVVGWYRQRRNSEQHMTFREKLVHEKLKAVLQNPHMIFFLLTSSRVTQTDSTHRMEYSAFTSCSRRFMSVPVLVTNLGLLEQQGYWKASVPCSASGYSLTMKKHRPKFFSPIGLLREVEEINKMNESLQDELQKVCAEVEESERSVKELQLDVSALRRRLRARQQGSAEGGAEEQHSLAGGDASAAQPRRNQLLLEAVRALLGSAPLFLTQTLDLQAVPVPDKTASPQNAEDTEQEESCGKRQREELQGRGRKRRRSSSPS